MNLQEKILKIKAVILDIDGVLTDGRIGYSENSNEVKFFHARDGFAIRMAIDQGFLVGVFSGRKSKANDIRIKELMLNFEYQGIKNKAQAFNQLLLDQNLKPEECLYIGDDIVDLLPLQKAGLGVVVGDAPAELDAYCDLRTKAFGGYGAVRETIEQVLKEQKKWNYIIEKYLGRD